ncbi:hypothetical protein FB451DRAFT_1172050 [Mycena latifolia]|nr:hypothetical protein FB451DRAFT_1172050 [Mycena latifolia]
MSGGAVHKGSARRHTKYAARGGLRAEGGAAATRESRRRARCTRRRCGAAASAAGMHGTSRERSRARRCDAYGAVTSPSVSIQPSSSPQPHDSPKESIAPGASLATRARSRARVNERVGGAGLRQKKLVLGTRSLDAQDRQRASFGIGEADEMVMA